MAFRLLLVALFLAACGPDRPEPITVVTGPDPVLPAPERGLFPTVNIAPATGWPEGAAPLAAPGLRVNAFAAGLDHPRWMHVLSNGDVLVAEANAQPRPVSGPRDLIERLVMGRAGARAPSADRITLLRDADGDGRADLRSVLIDDLTSPFGMSHDGATLFIANTDAVVAVPFAAGQTRIEATPRRVAPLPAEDPNRHWTKGMTMGRDGALYVSVGANSDHGENGMAREAGRAAIWRIDPRTGAARLFAEGLRNPVGMDWEPESGRLWTVVNERDELGDNLVPDYLTRVDGGAWYGWPHVYWEGRPDPRVDQSTRPDRTVRRPDYALGAHVAPLGLTFADGARLDHGSGAYVGRHGSWNRVPASGYDVVFVPFAGGAPAGQPDAVLTEFLDDAGNARGRPVGVEIAGDGALLVADDVGNVIWRVTRE